MSEMHDESSPPESTQRLAIGEVLASLQTDFPDVSISKIRFLESRGLVNPDRAPSGYRKFAHADVDRLRWILTMQRDHFLPLRVIKERIERGEVGVPTPAVPATAGAGVEVDGAAATPVTAAPPAAGVRAVSGRFRPQSAHDEYTVEEFGRHAGLTGAQINDLEQFGLIEPHATPAGDRYASDELQVAKAAAKFLQHGIEPRHLRAWRIAAEREAGMLEQIIAPLARQGDAEAMREACEVADNLIETGNRIRETIIAKSLIADLGLQSD